MAVRGVIQRVTQECTGPDNKHYLPVEAVEQQASADSGAASKQVGSVVCSSCRHRQCCICEEWSIAKEYSDYWICHCCGALTHRLQSWH
jgi:hypothetical protein